MSSELTDALGFEHTVATGTPRIVSLVPSITELLFALGLGRFIVGRTAYCVHPADRVNTVDTVGGTKKPRIERLLSLRPTHVVVNIEENEKTDVETLRASGLQVVVTYPLAPRDNLDLYRLLGAIFSRPRETARLCEAFEDIYRRLQDARGNRPARTALYLIWRKPWMSVSSNTYIGRMLELVNWHTPYQDTDHRYPEVTLEDPRLDAADLILFSSEPFPFQPKHLREFETRFAAGRRNLALIDGEMMSWYGSRAIDGLAYLDRFARSVDARSDLAPGSGL